MSLQRVLLFTIIVFVSLCEISVHGVIVKNLSFLLESDWRRTVDLAENGTFRLSWKLTEERIVFLVEARTRGYFGLGFSLDGRMSKADIAVGWVNDKTKKPHIVVSKEKKSILYENVRPNRLERWKK